MSTDEVVDVKVRRTDRFRMRNSGESTSCRSEAMCLM